MNKKSLILTSVFFGSLWGISEAVLGYLLHLIPFGLSGFIMFPIGCYFMYKAFKLTQNIKSIMYVGFIAAIIKLADLVLPFLPSLKILVPSAAILFESLSLCAAYLIFQSMRSKPSIYSIVFSSIAWRVVFTMLQVVLTLFGIKSGLISGGIISIASFILLEGIVNVLIIYTFVRFENKSTNEVYEVKYIRPVISLGTFILSVLLSITFCIL